MKTERECRKLCRIAARVGGSMALQAAYARVVRCMAHNNRMSERDGLNPLRKATFSGRANGNFEAAMIIEQEMERRKW
jgi:hypothetical protein